MRFLIVRSALYLIIFQALNSHVFAVTYTATLLPSSKLHHVVRLSRCQWEPGRQRIGAPRAAKITRCYGPEQPRVM